MGWSFSRPSLLPKSPMSPAPENPSMSFVMAGSALSARNPKNLVAMGRSAVPMVALAFSYCAVRRCCLPARVSLSLAKVPWASLVCLVIRDSVAAWLAWSDSAPPTFLYPRRAASASMLDCLRETPYFSMGSRSPLRAEDSAETASAVVPPNIADMSAPCLIRAFVLGASLSIAVPPFLSCEPMSTPSSLYSCLVRPTSVAAPFAQVCIVLALPLKTASIAPTDCSRSPAGLIILS